MEKIAFDLVFQVSVCVSDAEAVLNNWKKFVEIDEGAVIHRNLKELYDAGEYHCGNYMGNPCDYYHKLYRFDLGGIDFEIIEPITKEPGNPYSDFLIQNGGNGIHHIAVKMRDRDLLVKNMEELGIPVYTYGYQGQPLANGRRKDCYFYDLRELLGVIIEAGDIVVGPLANDPRAGNPADYDDRKHTTPAG